MRSSHESGPEGGSSRSLLHQAAFPSLALKQPRSERQSRMALCTARMAGAVFAPGGGGLASPTLAIHSVAARLVWLGGCTMGGRGGGEVWGLWRPPSCLQSPQAVDSHGVPGGDGRSQKSLFPSRWPDQMACQSYSMEISIHQVPKERGCS